MYGVHMHARRSGNDIVNYILLHTYDSLFNFLLIWCNKKSIMDITVDADLAS
jgi:hypothetical protein